MPLFWHVHLSLWVNVMAHKCQFIAQSFLIYALVLFYHSRSWKAAHSSPFMVCTPIKSMKCGFAVRCQPSTTLANSATVYLCKLHRYQAKVGQRQTTWLASRQMWKQMWSRSSISQFSTLLQFQMCFCFFCNRINISDDAGVEFCTHWGCDSSDLHCHLPAAEVREYFYLYYCI